MKENFKIDNLKEIARNVLEKTYKSQNDKAVVLALSGDLGAGKTTLTKELALSLGINENVISPTFVLMKIYQTNSIVFKKLIHIDAYRLEKEDELFGLGWEEILNNKENLIIVEWPEKVKICLPKETIWIKLGHVDEETRTIEF